jgi:putative peptidoglycan lipid II flippase
MGGLMLRGQYHFTPQVLRRIALLLLASGIMGAGLWWANSHLLAEVWQSGALLTRLFALAAMVGVGAAVFIALSFATGAVSVSWLKGGLKRRAKG